MKVIDHVFVHITHTRIHSRKRGVSGWNGVFQLIPLNRNNIFASTFGGRRFEFSSRPMLGTVDRVTSTTGLVENVDVAVEITLLSLTIQNFTSASVFAATILISGKAISDLAAVAPLKNPWL